MPSPKRRKCYRIVGCRIQIFRLAVGNCCLCSKLRVFFSLPPKVLVYLPVSEHDRSMSELVREVFIYIMWDFFHYLESLGEKHKGETKEFLKYLHVQPAKE